MKTLNRITKLLLFFLAVSLCSCEDWLDVKPRTEIESSVNFKSEQGYKDALTGVYVLMTNEGLYGKELSFGFIDVIGKQYTSISSGHEYYDDSQYNYKAPKPEARINAIWTGMYNVIANINNLIANIEQADPGMFTGNNYNIIKGEAYGLRAYIYFDLLRLFAPAPSSAEGLGSLAIPYSTKFTYKGTSRSTVAQVIELILADLAKAETLMLVDPILPENPDAGNSDYLRDRTFKFNYYAIKATQARVHLYNGDKVNALASAKTVIEAGAFSWTPNSEIAVPDPKNRNRIFSQELIFTLNINTLATIADKWFTTSIGLTLTRTNDEFNNMYESMTADYRYSYLLEDIAGIKYPGKLWQPTGIPYYAANRLPLIRLSEMYYIAAECLKDSDPTGSVGYLNTVRQKRNITTDISASLTADEILVEIQKEYEKELICEGQLFYFYKRLNYAEIAGNLTSKNIYVLPLPDAEVEFGTK